MLRLICCLPLVAGLWTAPHFATAHDGEGDHAHEPIAVEPADVYRPTWLPDRVVLSWSEDVCTTQSVTWRTSVDVATAYAEIAVAEAGPAYAGKATRLIATSEALKSDINTAHYHSVTFRDLTPATIYAYRVGDGVNWSEWFQFRTASEKPLPFSFIYFGDAQNNLRSLWSRVIREAQRDAPEAAFLLHAGDLVNKAESDAEWGEWFGAGGWLNAMMPSIAVPGNHEQAKLEDGTRRLSKHWQASFTFPQNGPVGLKESCYTLTYQNTRIICLNSNTMQVEQAKWLEEVLAANEKPWVICTFHHPIYSTGKDRDNAELRELWKPIFDKYKVDLVLQGHDHTYGRTGFAVPDDDGATMPMEAQLDAVSSAAEAAIQRAAEQSVPAGTINVPTGIQNVDRSAGTVYVVSVSGPKMYNNNRKWFMRRLAEDTQLYQIVHVDGRRLKFEARTAIGELYDAFELVKQPGEINKLVELGADVPENLRSLEEAAAEVAK